MTASLYLLHVLTLNPLESDPTMNIRSTLRSLPLLIPVAAAGLLTVPLASLAVLPVAPWAAGVGKTITLMQAVPVLLHDEGSAGSASGDTTFYKADLKKGGQAFGTLSGRINTHDIADVDANFEIRMRQLIFDLPGGQIVAMGSSTYPTGPDFIPLQVGASTTIAIVGGTGEYFGAKGELVTTRKADGTYKQVIRLAGN
ncbi:MAG: hypothetical protein NT059_08155 [Planctomycetota bacterium]|nr:hypothetical protein [Planctomycetota bacterium]